MKLIKNVLITEEIIGDLKDVLKTLNKRLKQQNHAEWLEKIQGYKEKISLKYHPNVLSGPFLVEEIYRQTNGEALIVTEVGQHQMWAAQYYKYTKTENPSYVRRTWNDGIWSWSGAWRKDRMSG